jgi:outer membrane receptor protein involved in Fe transport
VQPSLGELQQNNAFASGGYDTRVQDYSATFKAKAGSVELTALSGYSVSKSSLKFDSTSFFGTAFIQSLFPTATAAPSIEDIKTSKFTQEVRMVVPLGARVEWQLGGFYNHETSPETQEITAKDFTTGEIFGSFIHFTNSPYTFKEYAAFTDFTVRVTDRFDVQLGGRESQNEQALATTYSGAVFGPTPVLIPETDSKDNSFTYLVTPRLKLSSDLMVYARLASGYRPGGPNGTAGVPLQFKPDKTENYEVGLKGAFLDHTLTVDASVYYIDWKDIQIHLLSPSGGYISNGSRAKSQGVEISVESRPVSGLTLAGWVAYDDAKLTEDFPVNSAVYGVSGDRLPDTSRFSGNVAADEEFPLMSDILGFVGGTASYVGDRVGVFTAPPPAVPPRQSYPSYTRVDFRAGVK